MAALALLAVSTALFAYARDLPTLFAARMLQGVADAVTWVVGPRAGGGSLPTGRARARAWGS